MEKLTKQQLAEKCTEIEAEIVDLLDQSGSDFVFDDVKDIIFHEEESDDFQKLVMLCDNGDPSNLSNVLETMTDAWNYFPHKALGGKSPAEILQEN